MHKHIPYFFLLAHVWPFICERMDMHVCVCTCGGQLLLSTLGIKAGPFGEHQGSPEATFHMLAIQEDCCIWQAFA